MLVALFAQSGSAQPLDHYDAWIDSPGGKVRFGLELSALDAASPHARIINGDEVVEPVTTRPEPGVLLLRFEPYESELRITKGQEAGTLSGEWTKRRNADETFTMPFHAAPRAPVAHHLPSYATLHERWAIQLESREDLVVGLFTATNDGRARGTIMTTTGDSRYLQGTYDGTTLELHSFDGTKAYILRATFEDKATMKGQTWSGPTSTDTFTATANPSVTLPDDLAQTRALSRPDLDTLAFQNAEGQLIPLSTLIDGPAVINVFGTWCPNCNDAAALMKHFDETYRARGLRVVGLAYELRGDHAQDWPRVESFRARNAISYPLLLAGVSKKELASTTLPFLDEVRSFPTTIFIDRHGNVRAVHSGFAGPATGEHHDALVARLTQIVESMLTE